jgi:glycine cleavage system transcriptional repressor
MPTLAVSAVGLDRPGIIAAVAERLAAHGVNVCDLQTRLAGDLYVMIMDVAVPPAVADLDERLRAVAAAQDVAITLRPVDPDVL